MFLHQSAYLDQYLNCAGYPGHMHHVKQFQGREEICENTYIQHANWTFGNVELGHGYWVAPVVYRAEVAFLAEVVSALESDSCVGWLQIHLFLWVSSMSAEFSQCHDGKQRDPAVWFWRSMVGCPSLAACTILCSGNSKPRFYSAQASGQGFLIRYCVSLIAAHENPPLSILALFRARRMFDYSSCTRPPCLAIVADMLETYKKLLAPLTMRFG